MKSIQPVLAKRRKAKALRVKKQKIFSKDKYYVEKNSTEETVKYHIWVYSHISQGWIRIGIITGYNNREEAQSFVKANLGPYSEQRWILTKSVIIESNLVTPDSRID